MPQCHAVIAQLLERVKLLEERISLDSNDSSKPPSSDGPGRAKRAQRRSSKRKRGAQPGHKAHSRAILAEREVDRMVDCKPAATCECGGPVELAAAPLRHQVFEVPPMRAQVHWYWLYSGRCAHETCLRQGVDFWDFMHRAVDAFIANTDPPSLMPRTAPPSAAPTGCSLAARPTV